MRRVYGDILTGLIGALIAIGRNLPFDIYLFGLSIIDALVLAWAAKIAISGVKFEIDYVAKCMSIVIIFTLVSLFFNAFIYGAQWSELFEVGRYATLVLLYYFLLRNVSSVCAAIYGFTFGNILVFLVAYQYPMNPDVHGFVQIFNPNVIGAIISVNGMLLLWEYARRPRAAVLILIIIIVICTIFTYSKGAWLMSAWTIICFTILAAYRVMFTRSVYSAIHVSFVLALIIGSIFSNFEALSQLVISKLIATDFQATAVEGGSFSARLGLAYSGIIQWSLNPFFGVGISNFELLNARLEKYLGDFYYHDDNPNNVFIYILSGSGFFAFCAWVLMFIKFIHLSMQAIWRATRSKTESLVIGFNVVGIMLIAGSTQNEMLNGYYYWFILAMVNLGLVSGHREPFRLRGVE